jgi:signal transduction histidine kinase/DNA-binding response OmpR family regulator
VVVNVLSKATALQEWLGEREEKLERVKSVMKDHSIEELEWEINELEGRLREVENYLENILETSGECIIVTELSGNIMRINAALVNILGYTIEELLGKRLLDIIPVFPGDYISTTGESVVIGDEFLAKYEKVQSKLLQEGKVHYETYFLQKCGKIVPMEMSTTILYDEEGGEDRTVSVGRNVTERNKLFETLKKAKEKAEESTRSKSQFLANMSHEIRTPMNAVIGFTQELLETELNADQAEYVQIIKQSGDALLALVDDILDITKIDAGKMELEQVDFDPELLAYDVCKLIMPKAEKKQLEILCRIGDELPSYVRGDVTRFRQVLVNLMGNAVKFTHKGEIELSLGVEEETKDQVKLHAKVRDTGIGIPQDQLESIFEVFKQTDGSTTREYGGSGLGLSISKRISQVLEGELWAESPADFGLQSAECRLDSSVSTSPKLQIEIGNPNSPMGGPGSIFHCTAWFKKSTKKPSAMECHVSFERKKMLIVGDNKNNLTILERPLHSMGVRVQSVSEAENVEATALAAVNEGDPFDLAILDIQMPRISGYEIARRFRQDERLKTLPLLAVSSSTVRGAKKCREAGFDGFLPKPVHRQKLFNMLERLLGTGEQDSNNKNHLRTANPAKERREGIATQYTLIEEAKHSVRILLVEDNPVNQKLALKMIEKAGYQVETANNGKEAVEMYKKSIEGNGESGSSKEETARYHLIFMDVQMPVMDGLKATKLIRTVEGAVLNDARREQSPNCNPQPTIKRIPIIAMTANAMDGDRDKCLTSGMDDYIPKPIKREVVFKVIEKWVNVLKG